MVFIRGGFHLNDNSQVERALGGLEPEEDDSISLEYSWETSYIPTPRWQGVNIRPSVPYSKLASNTRLQSVNIVSPRGARGTSNLLHRILK